MYFRLEMNLGVIFQRALGDPRAVLSLIYAHADGCGIDSNSKYCMGLSAAFISCSGPSVQNCFDSGNI